MDISVTQIHQAFGFIIWFLSLHCCSCQDKGIIAYFESGCPDGWSSYSNLAGRVAIGTGSYSSTAEDGRTESSTYTAGESGGEIAHTLTVAELANHNHNDGGYTILLNNDGTYTENSHDNGNQPNLNEEGTIQSAGNDDAHNNMQPYYVLYACIKTSSDNYTTVPDFLNLETTVEGLDNDIQMIENNIANAIEVNISSLSDSIGIITGNVSRLDGIIENMILRNISSIDEDIQALQIDSNMFELNITTLDQRLECLQSILDNVTVLFINDITELENENLVLQNNIEELYNKNEQLGNKTVALEEENDILLNNISDLQTRLNTVETMLAELLRTTTSTPTTTTAVVSTTSITSTTEEGGLNTTVVNGNEAIESLDNNSKVFSMDSEIIFVIIGCLILVLLCCLMMIIVYLYKNQRSFNDMRDTHEKLFTAANSYDIRDGIEMNGISNNRSRNGNNVNNVKNNDNDVDPDVNNQGLGGELVSSKGGVTGGGNNYNNFDSRAVEIAQAQSMIGERHGSNAFANIAMPNGLAIATAKDSDSESENENENGGNSKGNYKDKDGNVNDDVMGSDDDDMYAGMTTNGTFTRGGDRNRINSQGKEGN